MIFTFSSGSSLDFGFQQNGVVNNRLISFLGSVFLFGLILVFIVLFHLLLYLLRNTNGVINKLAIKLGSKIYWAYILTYVIESYLSYAIGM